MLIDPLDEAKGLEPRSEDLSNTAGALAELDLNKLPDFYLAMGWQADAEAALFFENLRLQDLSLEELKVLYLMQLTESQKMSDLLAKLCQLDSEGWL
jgi:hypothetical protein